MAPFFGGNVGGTMYIAQFNMGHCTVQFSIGQLFFGGGALCTVHGTVLYGTFLETLYYGTLYNGAL